MLEGEKVYRLRGLCRKQTQLDTDYILLMDHRKKGEIIFLGMLGKSLIRLGKQSWDMSVIQNGKVMVVGKLENDDQVSVL
jgi:hypothetical protein